MKNYILYLLLFSFAFAVGQTTNPEFLVQIQSASQAEMDA